MSGGVFSDLIALPFKTYSRVYGVAIKTCPLLKVATLVFLALTPRILDVADLNHLSRAS